MHSKKRLRYSLSVLVAFGFLLLGGCSSWFEKEIVVTESENDDPVIQRADPPKPLDLYDVRWYVVTEDNYNAFEKKIKDRLGGELVFYAIVPKGYENLALNLEQIRSYLKQQKAVIAYYETYLYNEKESDDDESGN